MSFKSMFDQERSFNRKFNFVFGLIVFVQACVVIGIITVATMLISNPEAVGAFFGKIVSGFKSASH